MLAAHLPRGGGQNAGNCFGEWQSPKLLNKDEIMQNAPFQNPNDHKVVSFRNSTDFGFTPEMGCMYDGRAINGKNGSPGIDIGETVILPYHIGRQLALNLAKVAINKTAPATDVAGIPTGVPLWDEQRLNKLRDSYLADLYTEEKPVAISETDKLMAKVEEYKKMVEDLVAGKAPETPIQNAVIGAMTPASIVYQDKQEVIAELEKRNIPHDKRKNKADLEKLLA